MISSEMLFLTNEHVQAVLTIFSNQGTQGLQFAAVGGTAYEMAKAQGLGHPMPKEWFLQKIRDQRTMINPRRQA